MPFNRNNRNNSNNNIFVGNNRIGLNNSNKNIFIGNNTPEFNINNNNNKGTNCQKRKNTCDNKSKISNNPDMKIFFSNDNKKNFISNSINEGVNYSFNIDYYKSIILKRVKKCNEWIDLGKYSYYNSYKNYLKNEVDAINEEITKCNNLINIYQQKKDYIKMEIAQKLKNDIEQTINRYNLLKNDKPMVKFCSSFEEYNNKLNFSAFNINPVM